jgi:hypothetical protein
VSGGVSGSLADILSFTLIVCLLRENILKSLKIAFIVAD